MSCSKAGPAPGVEQRCDLGLPQAPPPRTPATVQGAHCKSQTRSRAEQWVTDRRGLRLPTVRGSEGRRVGGSGGRGQQWAWARHSWGLGWAVKAPRWRTGNLRRTPPRWRRGQAKGGGHGSELWGLLTGRRTVRPKPAGKMQRPGSSRLRLEALGQRASQRWQEPSPLAPPNPVPPPHPHPPTLSPGRTAGRTGARVGWPPGKPGSLGARGGRDLNLQPAPPAPQEVTKSSGAAPQPGPAPRTRADTGALGHGPAGSRAVGAGQPREGPPGGARHFPRGESAGSARPRPLERVPRRPAPRTTSPQRGRARRARRGLRAAQRPAGPRVGGGPRLESSVRGRRPEHRRSEGTPGK